MPDSNPQSGDVYYYPYVWNRQPDGASAEKDRPCCVAIRLPHLVNGVDVYLLALSTSGLPEGGDGIVVPAHEVARLRGPDPRKECWLTTSEFNATRHTSQSFMGMEYRGSFSADFMRNAVRPKVIAMLQVAVARQKTGQ